MTANSAAGVLGIVVQLAVFLLVTVLASHRGYSRSVVYGGIVAIFGYALVVAFLGLVGISWQIVNIALALGVVSAAFLRPVRAGLLPGLHLLATAVRKAWAATTIVACMLLVTVGIAAIEAEPSIDGQLYHGPTLASIMQSGSLWGWAAPNQYVFYTDLSMAGGVNLATFAGDARFDNAIQVPHLLLLVALISWALRRRFTSTFTTVALASLIVAAPVIWLQARILYVDLAYGAAVVAAIFFIVLVREFRAIDVIVAGISLAAVFATKPSGILTGAILLVAFAVAVLVRRRKTSRVRRTWALLAGGLLPPLLMGTSFYVRNLVQFSNPLYPIEAKFGPIVFPGIVDVSIFASGERGNGFVDPSRWVSYAHGVGSGMVHGVTKLDYDPRAGGFGYMPTLLLSIVLALVVVQVITGLRSRTPGTPLLSNWRSQVTIVGLAGAILLVQPSTFDTRYVIGPTVVLLVALLLTDVFPLTSRMQLVAGILALVCAGGLVVQTERTMYPGLKSAVAVMRGPAEWQPLTPAGLGPQGLLVAWLPDARGECVSIALQTMGGVTPQGMIEQSQLGTLTYGLYGDELCNTVQPVTLKEGKNNTSAFAGADFMVLYSDDVRSWMREFPELKDCLQVTARIKSTDYYPQGETVFRNICS